MAHIGIDVHKRESQICMLTPEGKRLAFGIGLGRSVYYYADEVNDCGGRLSILLLGVELLQGPLADAMTHVGQLAMLRRLAGAPVQSENFIFADIRAGTLGSEQSLPVAPDVDWSPDRPPLAPGRRRVTD